MRANVRRFLASLTLIAATFTCVVVSPAEAQVAPHAKWRTMSTARFDVHYPPGLEEVARRAAGYAEQSYDMLAAHLRPPRGRIAFVVSDDSDLPNGFATPFPSNRFTVFTRPPLDVASLRHYEDGLQLLVLHELVHIFHLDRAGGWWGAAQRVLGRNPLVMPNIYTPSWVAEGLAVYYESALTEGGRVRGSHERMIVRAEALEGRFPRIGEWSLTTTRMPGGEIAYAFGGLFFDHLATLHGPESVAEFVERSSRLTLPFTLDRAARRSFGSSFERAWRGWRDSLSVERVERGPVMPGWRELTTSGRLTIFPRWRGDDAIVFSAGQGRRSPAAYEVNTNGDVSRISRRNNVEANAIAADGSLIFSQIDFTDPYRLRADLYAERDGRVTRLTRGARLTTPDVRADGEIVAVRAGPQSAQLVRVSGDGARITELSAASPDTQWSEPRWSPTGDRIAVTRWTRGGYVGIVILDTLGRTVREIGRDRAFEASPSWSPDGRTILFSSDRTGVSELYVADAEGNDEPRRISRATVGIFYPNVSPDGSTIAAARYGPGGWFIGTAPFDTAGATAAPLDPGFADVPVTAAPRETAPSRPYRAWRTLRPHWWMPLVAQSSAGDYTFGGYTSGMDVIGRHAYEVEAMYDPSGAQHSGNLTYRWAGLGVPVVEASGRQQWERTGIFDRNTRSRIGWLNRRTRETALAFTFTRPRVRQFAFARVGGDLEWRDYTTDPEPLLPLLPSFFSSGPQYRAVFGSVGWSNAQRPALSISPEDGLSASATGRLRYRQGGGEARSVAASLSGYKSLDLPGFAHHVLAARVAAGASDGDDAGTFSVGGGSGEPVELLGGFSTGGRRTFFVRGFPAGAQSGTRAASATAEYRAPLGTAWRQFGLRWAYLDRMSISAFGDAGAAWTPELAEVNGVLPEAARARWIAGAGVELVLDAAAQYDIPYRLRFGVGVPVVDPQRLAERSASIYLQFGTAF